MIHNDLDNMSDCINAPDIMQDAKIDDLEQRVERVENKTLINEVVR